MLASDWKVVAAWVLYVNAAQLPAYGIFRGLKVSKNRDMYGRDQGRKIERCGFFYCFVDQRWVEEES